MSKATSTKTPAKESLAPETKAPEAPVNVPVSLDDIRAQVGKEINDINAVYRELVVNKFFALATKYEQLPSDIVIQFLGELGFRANGSAPKTKLTDEEILERSRKKVSDKDIVTFCATEKTSAQIEGQFKLAPNTSKRMNVLKDAGQVEMRQDGTSKFWKATSNK